MSKGPPPADYDDNPVWTDADIARARPGREVLPPAVLAALTRDIGARPHGATKQQVSLRLDRDVIDRFRAAGPGWQTRMNEALRRAAP